MRIDRIELQNFRGISSLPLDLHPQFNLLAGINGSGKTTILEALTVAMGSLFLGIRGQDARHIRKDDIRYQSFGSGRVEWQFPVIVKSTGVVNQVSMEWLRELDSPEGKTRFAEATNIRSQARVLDQQVRAGRACILPLIAYYSAGRLWVERKEMQDSDESNVPSRFRGYYNALQASSQFRHFLKWFKEKQLADLQRGTVSIEIQTISNAIFTGIPECNGLRYEFDPDKIQTLMVSFVDGRELPFDALSDGTRNLIALFADIAHRAVLLNPHLLQDALSQTPGIVLIDELDLHLHPQWQKRIVGALLHVFPQIQFVVSSHSPFLLQEADRGKLIQLSLTDSASEINENMNVVHDITAEAVNQSLEEIAENIQGVENAPWSSQRNEMFAAATEYYQVLHQMTGSSAPDEINRLKERLDSLLEPYLSNVAFAAFLRQERLVREAQLGRGEA